MPATAAVVRDGLYIAPSRINASRHPWVLRATSDTLGEREPLGQSCWVRSHARPDKRRVYSLLTISRNKRSDFVGKAWKEPTRFLEGLLYQDETKAIFRQEQYAGRVVVQLDGALAEEWGHDPAALVVYDADRRQLDDGELVLSVRAGDRDLSGLHPVHPRILKMRIFVRTGRTQVVINFMGAVGANRERVSLLKTVRIILRALVAVPGAASDLGFSVVSSEAPTERDHVDQSIAAPAARPAPVDAARAVDWVRAGGLATSFAKWIWDSVTCRYAGVGALVVAIGWLVADVGTQIILQLVVAAAASFFVQLRWAARVRTTASIKLRSVSGAYWDWIRSSWTAEASSASVEVGRLRRLWTQRPRMQYAKLDPLLFVGGDEAKRGRQMLGLIVWGLLVAVLYLLLGEWYAVGDGRNLPWIWQQAESTLIAVTIIITVATSGLIGLYQAVQQQTAAFRTERQRLIAELLAPLASLDKLASDRWEAFHEQLHAVGESFMYLANQVWAAPRARGSGSALAPEKFLATVVADGTAEREPAPRIAGGLAGAWVLSDADQTRLGGALQSLEPPTEGPATTVRQRTESRVARADLALRRLARSEALSKSDQSEVDRLRWLLSLVPETDKGDFVGFYPSSTDLTYLFADALFFDERTEGWWESRDERLAWRDEAVARIEEFTRDVGQDRDEEDLLEWLDDAQEKATQLGLDWSNMLDDLLLFNDLKLKARLRAADGPTDFRTVWLRSQWLAYAAAYSMLITRTAPPHLAAADYWPGLPSLPSLDGHDELELASRGALEEACSRLEQRAASVESRAQRGEGISWSERLLLIEVRSEDGILFNWMRAIRARRLRADQTQRLLAEMEMLAREGGGQTEPGGDRADQSRVEVLGIILEPYRSPEPIGRELRVIAQPTVLNRQVARL
ncbi:MAG: hypothetical protein ACKORC_08630 [Acidimicrobiia bacterium]